jgi:hypothetical protein
VVAPTDLPNRPSDWRLEQRVGAYDLGAEGSASFLLLDSN